MIVPETSRGKYKLTATRGQNVVLREHFDDLLEAHAATGKALARYPDCEVRLKNLDVVLIAVAPARAG